MRSALWETSAGALIALLNSGQPLQRADLYTLTLHDGTVYRWSGFDSILVGNGHTWTIGPGFQRGRVRSSVGTSVDDLTVTLIDIAGTTINGVALPAFIRSGGLVGARMQVDRAYFPAGTLTPVGAVFVFAGRVNGVTNASRRACDLTLTADITLLDVMVPREVYQPQCRNTVFDSACLLDQSAYTVTGAASAGTGPARTSFNQSLSQASGYFALGTLTMTSGQNSGISRSVKTYINSGAIVALNPWPFPVVTGDTFAVIPGCDGTQDTCTNKFSNLSHFRGFPFIPLSSIIIP